MTALGYVTHWGTGLGQLGLVWFWGGLCIVLVCAAVVVVLWVAPRYREKRSLAALQAEESPTPGQEADKSLSQLRVKMLAALQTLENAPDFQQPSGLPPPYILPWYLLVGANQSGKTTLLRRVASSLA